MNGSKTSQRYYLPTTGVVCAVARSASRWLIISKFDESYNNIMSMRRSTRSLGVGWRTPGTVSYLAGIHTRCRAICRQLPRTYSE